VVVADMPFDLLPRMTRLICRAVPGVDECGITVLYDGQAVTLAFSSDLAALNDELQYTANAGPCLQALHDRAVVESPDLTTESRWGRYPAAAVGCGMHSVLSLPIDATGAGRGVLNLYSHVVQGFDEEDRLAAAEFAGIIADLVVASGHPGTDSTMARRFHQALAHRSAVAQAVGVYMARHRCDPEEAFQLLLLTSREHGEDIYTTAARIGATTGPTDD
jgi:putative methionine-R-sulfoxide reductase with GAF domain